MQKKHFTAAVLLLAGILFFSAPSFSSETIHKKASFSLAPFPEVSEASDVSSAQNAVVLVYMIGSDLESVDGSASDDLYEILSGSSTDKLKVLVETGGAKKWKSKKNLGVSISSKSSQRYLLSNGKMKKVYDAGKRKDMSDPSTLRDFLLWAKENYPADRYQLIFWNHGGGSLGGFGQDEFHPKDSLTADEIASVLSETGLHFDFIGYDACLMATLENALTLSPYADYFIASEETESGFGWEYSTWIQQLSKNPSVSTLKLAKTLIDDSVYVVKKYDSTTPATFAIMDLKEIATLVPPVLDSFGEACTKELEKGKFKDYSKYRKAAKAFGTENTDSIDLINFCKKVGSPEAQALSSVLKSCIKYSKTYSIKNANGIASYFPFYDFDTYEQSYENYKQMALGEKYPEFINHFSTIALGGSLSNQHSSSAFDQNDSDEDDWDNWDDLDDLDDWDDWDDWDELIEELDELDNTLDELDNMLNNRFTFSVNAKRRLQYLEKAATSTEASIKAEAISIKPKKKELAIGESFTIVPSLTPADSTEKIIFCSSAPEIASVTADGKVTAVSRGKAVIAAAVPDSQLIATCRIVVSEEKTFDAYADKEWFDESLANSLKDYYKTNQLPDELPLIKKGKGKNTYYALHLSKKIWNLIDDEQLQVYLKDKKGGCYFLGSDRYANFDKQGDLMVNYNDDYTWLSINGQLVSCYSDTYESYGKNHWYEISRIPACLNGESADILIRLDDTHKSFYVVGARMNYSKVASKGLRKIKKGDRIQFVCQYFDKNGKESTKKFGKPMTITTSQDKIKVTYKDLGDYDTQVCYQLTDFFNNNYWTEMIKYH